MTATSATLPAEADMLCEVCGYVLNGLQRTSNCPECGSPVAASDSILRTPPAWESSQHRRFSAFWTTTAAVLAHPATFYRSLPAQGDMQRAVRFAHLHMAIAGAIFGGCAFLHASWLSDLGASSSGVGFFNVRIAGIDAMWPLGLAGMLGGYLTMLAVAWIAARLTSFEARYWGMRLPLPTVRRVLAYHAAHYLPVAIITLVTIGGYLLLRSRGVFGFRSDVAYLYTLCGLVVICAYYLFRTYWVGMKKLMYANYR